MKHKHFEGAIKAITEDADYVYIEGYANLSQPDESGERLDAESMDDSRYIDNPILLFNHVVSYVVGKTLKWRQEAKGFWVRCAISKSAHADIAYVRDLVIEGILKCFSVGFSGGKAEPDPQYPGKLFIRDWKLHEISIVPIPMQAQSTFSVTKSLSNNLKRCKSLSEARVMTLQMKGAKVAALLAPVLENMQPDVKDAAIAKLVETAGISSEEVQSIISGEVQTLSETVIAAIANVFSVDANALSEANKEDTGAPAESETPPPETPLESPQNAPLEAPLETPPATDKPAIVMDTPALSDVALSIRECVIGKLPALMSAGNSKEESVAMAISECSSEKGCAPSDLSDADWGSFLSLETPEVKAAEPVKTKEAYVDTGDNIHVQLMQQTVQMLGAIAVKLDSIIAVINNTSTQPAVPAVTPAVISLSTDASDLEMKSLLQESKELNTRLKSWL